MRILLIRFCEWLEKKLFDEMTWRELDERRIELEIEIDELEDRLETYQEERIWN